MDANIPKDKVARAAEVETVCAIIEREKNARKTEAREETERQAAQAENQPPKVDTANL